MVNKVKALAWEECRTGGVIALFCSIVGTIIMVSYRYQTGYERIEEDAMLYIGLICGIPMSIALLLTLNPDHTGHLSGGYSSRILELPVPTYIPVIISFFARSTFVFLAALLSVAVAKALYYDPPGYALAVSLLVMYMGLQLLDWLRKLVSGLTSILLVLLLSTFALLLYAGDSFAIIIALRRFLLTLEETPSTIFIGPLIIFTVGTLISISIVSATRIGKKYGFPEIWEWHRAINVSSGKQHKPFQSPIAARVWLDLRRSYFLLPVVTVLITITGSALVWFYILSNNEHSNYRLKMSLSYIPFLGLIFGALAQGAKTAILSFGKTKGLPGYTYLQPITTAQIANARMISNALVLFPTVAMIILIHFSVPGLTFVTQVIPDALRSGVTSYHEVVWTLLSRGIFIALIGWGLLTIITRLFVPILIVIVAMFPVLWLLKFRGEDIWFMSFLSLSIFLISLCIFSFVRAWKTRLISTSVLMFWVGAWALVSWSVFGPFVTVISLPYPSLLWFAPGICVCLGIGSLVPLPFLATLFDVHKKRHSAFPQQTSPTNTRIISWFAMNSREKQCAVAGLVVVLIALWLGLPQRPAYESLWRSHNLPTNLEELNDWYPAVPDSENVALEYMDIAEITTLKDQEFRVMITQRYNNDLDPDLDENTLDIRIHNNDLFLYNTRDHFENIMIMGSARTSRSESIPSDFRIATNEYWRHVTRHAATQLKEIASRENVLSRHPIDLRDGFRVELPNLYRTRRLARHLSIDALHWTWENDTIQATDSILAMLPVAKTLENEPLLISALLRISVMGITQGTLQDLMNMTSFSKSDLLKLQHAFENEFSDDNTYQFLYRPMIGESIIALSGISLYPYGDVKSNRLNSSQLPLRQLVAPTTSEYMVFGLSFKNVFNTERMGWVADEAEMDDHENLIEDVFMFAPMSTIMLPALNRAYEAESRIRTQFDLAITALAIERYRIAHENIPDTLNALVPDYLDSVPSDYYAKGNPPIKYRIKDNGEYVVYSVGRDMEDDHGEEMESWRHEGDITFTVAAPNAASRLVFESN